MPPGHSHRPGSIVSERSTIIPGRGSIVADFLLPSRPLIFEHQPSVRAQRARCGRQSSSRQPPSILAIPAGHSGLVSEPNAAPRISRLTRGSCCARTTMAHSPTVALALTGLRPSPTRGRAKTEIPIPTPFSQTSCRSLGIVSDPFMKSLSSRQLGVSALVELPSASTPASRWKLTSSSRTWLICAGFAGQKLPSRT